MNDKAYIEIKKNADNFVQLRYWTEFNNEFFEKTKSLNSIEILIKKAEIEYYLDESIDIHENEERLEFVGKELYDWLNEDGLLNKIIENCSSKVLALAISVEDKLSHLPWEVLHDGNSFLTQRKFPSVVPIRWKLKQGFGLSSIKSKPLKVLYMSCIPLELEGHTLDFDKEEAEIVKKAGHSIDLVVEDSGDLNQLTERLEYYGGGENGFDIIHLSGHASEGYFITENDIGQMVKVNADDIGSAIPYFPKIIFLSGCYTSKDSNNNAIIPSLCLQLINLGAKLVVGWGQKVTDKSAIDSASTLYEKLSKGKKVYEAFSDVYKLLYANKHFSWHMFRIFIQGEIPNAIVVPPSKQTSIVFQRTKDTIYLDAEKRVEIIDYQNFIGRRREIQTCIKILRYDEKKYFGICITGMGGNGKTSLAYRLMTRLKDQFITIILSCRSNYFDIANLRKQLIDQLEDANLRDRLRYVKSNGSISIELFDSSKDTNSEFIHNLNFILTNINKRVLFVIDDFESAFKKNSAGRVLFKESQLPELDPHALECFKVLVGVVSKIPGHRILITSRYLVDSIDLNYFYHLPLNGLKKNEVLKKINKLENHFNQNDLFLKLSNIIYASSINNPRLIEWLLKIPETITISEGFIEKIKTTEEEFREHILAKEIIGSQSKDVLSTLNLISVFRIPISGDIVKELSSNKESIHDIMAQCLKLGLIEKYENQYGTNKVHYSLPYAIKEMFDGREFKQYELVVNLLKEEWKLEDENISISEEQLYELRRLAIEAKNEDIIENSTLRIMGLWLKQGKNYTEILEINLKTEQIITKDSYKLEFYKGIATAELDEISKGINIFEKALKSCPRDDENTRANILLELATRLDSIGKPQEALKRIDQALKLNKKLKKNLIEANGIAQKAWIYSHLGKLKDSKQMYEDSINLYKKEGDKLAEATTLINLAYQINFVEGNISLAIHQLIEAKTIFEENGAILHQAAALHNLADIYSSQGKYNEARNFCEESIELSKSVKSTRGLAATLRVYAKVLNYLGYDELALEKYKDAIKLSRRINEKTNMAVLLHEFSDFWKNKKDFKKALINYNKALKIYEKLGNKHGEASVYTAMGELWIEDEFYFEKGLEYMLKGLSIFIDIHEYANAIVVLDRVTEIFLQNELYDEALKFLYFSLEVKKELEGIGISNDLFKIAKIKYAQKKLDEAIRFLEESLAIEEELNNLSNQLVINNLMVDIYEDLGKIDIVAIKISIFFNLFERLDDQEKMQASKIYLKFSIKNYCYKIKSLNFRFGLEFHGELYNLLKLAEESNEFISCALVLDMIGSSFEQNQELDKAGSSYEKSFDYILRKNDEFNLLSAFMAYKIACILELKGDLKEAKEKKLKSIAIFNTKLGRSHNLSLKIANSLNHTVATPNFRSLNINWENNFLYKFINLEKIDISNKMLKIYVGQEIVSLFDPSKGSAIISKISTLRKKLIIENNFLLPLIQITDEKNIAPHTYIMSFNGQEILNQNIHSSYFDQTDNIENLIIQKVEYVITSNIDNILSGIDEAAKSMDIN